MCGCYVDTNQLQLRLEKEIENMCVMQPMICLGQWKKALRNKCYLF